jgi:flagellar M-ring protein FliF
MEKAKEILLKIFGFIRTKWEAASRNARIITLAVTVAVAASAVMLIAIANRVDYEMIYNGVDSAEMRDIAVALQDMGITSARLTGNTVSVPRDIADDVRMGLAIEGFPRSTTLNYDIWNNGIGIFSTDAQTKELQRQGLEVRITATLRRLTLVQDAAVTITMPESRPYVLNPDRRPSRASVVLTLVPGARLSNEQINGIKHIVVMAIPELTLENLTLNDQHGLALIADETTSIEEQLILERQRLAIQRAFERDLEEDLEAKIAGLYDGVVRAFRVGVTAQVSHNEWIEETRDYTGANTHPETGRQEGILESRTYREAWNALVPEDGAVGTTVNADISPNYPTFVGEAGTEAFYERLDETIFLVNERKRQTTSNGYTVERVTAAVQLDVGALTQEQIDNHRRLVALAIGTYEEDVMVIPTNFILPAPDLQPQINVSSPVRNVLVFIIISLGALLIILFILAIASSGSKKRRLIRSRATAFQGGGVPTFGEEGFGTFPVGKPFEEEEEKIEIQSLLGAGDGDTRETLLKNEIREFAKTNPDIVAQLIRTWIREG